MTTQTQDAKGEPFFSGQDRQSNVREEALTRGGSHPHSFALTRATNGHIGRVVHHQARAGRTHTSYRCFNVWFQHVLSIEMFVAKESIDPFQLRRRPRQLRKPNPRRRHQSLRQPLDPLRAPLVAEFRTLEFPGYPTVKPLRCLHPEG